MSLDVPQLRTASTYVNNLLLARGLLRNGRAIDFAALGSSESRDAGKEHGVKKSVKHAEIAAEVINLVHDLILRRDRETEQLNAFSETLTDLRAAASNQSGQLDRVRAQNKDLSRQLDSAQSALRSANASFQNAESTAKALREELVKTKATLTQVRTQCANDIRKRDVQIQRLKGHLTSSQRGSNGRMVGPTCSINAGASSSKIAFQGVGTAATVGKGSHGGAGGRRGEEEVPPSLEDAEYSLKQETTEFLTQLSQNLSDENDSLISLVRSTLTTLRELQNLPPAGSQDAKHKQNSGTEDDLVHVVPSSFMTLSADLEFVLANLKIILTNASFVPIDEVYARDEEICRLREGWERMESRWREAVDMMKGWQARMLSGGGTVNLEELKLGLGLGDGLQHLEDMPSIFSPNSASNEEYDEKEMVMPDLPEDEASFAGEDDNIVVRVLSGADDHLLEAGSSPLSSKSVSTALKEGTANIKVVSPQNNFATQTENQEQENLVKFGPTLDITDPQSAGIPAPPIAETSKPISKKENPARDKKVDTMRNSSDPSSPGANTRLDKYQATKPHTSKTRTPHKDNSRSRIHARLSANSTPMKDRPQTASPEIDPEPPLTVEQKLRHAEAEARRVSGSSVSESPPASPKQHVNREVEKGHNEDAQVPQDVAQPEMPEQSADTTSVVVTKDTVGNAEERKLQRSAAASGTATAPRGSRTLGAKARATGPTAASRAGTLPRRGTTTTTRIPTKPPASDAPQARKRTTKPQDLPAGAEAVVEAAMRRSRRKRKSTLSPEELEELMGLRRRAEAETEAELVAPE